MGLTELLLLHKRKRKDLTLPKQSTKAKRRTITPNKPTPELPQPTPTLQNETLVDRSVKIDANEGRHKVKVEVIEADACFQDDAFETHVSKELTDGEAQSLAENRACYHAWQDARFQAAWPEAQLEVTEGVEAIAQRGSLSECGVMQTLQQSWHRLHTERHQALQHSRGEFGNDPQQLLFSLFSEYRNVFYPIKKYPTKEEGLDRDAVLDAAVLHCVRHVRRSKHCLQRQINDRELKKQRKKRLKHETPSLKTEASEESPTAEPDHRIFGFAFPKVLFLVPMRNTAYNVVQRILQLASPDQSGLDKVMERLRVNYGPDDALEAAFKRRKKVERQKPADHDAVFYGHVSDTVTIGIKMHLNGALSVFRPLSESDIFVASPLSLSLLLEKKPQETTDWLSSIEILVIDRAEVMLMQNWQHVLRSLQHLNQMPKSLPTDISVFQIRRHFLQDQAACFRQTLLFSAFPSAEMHALFNGPLCRNHAGRIRFSPIYPAGLLSQSPFQRMTHRFDRHDCPSIRAAADARFDAFRSSLLPKLRLSTEAGILLFVPSYLDFRRVVDLMSKEDIDAVALSEYTGSLQSKKLRQRFRDGAVRILIITERFYFYNRPRLKGIQSLYFYALPDHMHFYTELLTAMPPGSHTWTLFSRFSMFQLERLVGSVKARRMMTGRTGVITEVL